MTEATGSLHGPPDSTPFEGWIANDYFQRTLGPRSPARAQIERAARIDQGRAILSDRALLATLPQPLVVDAQQAVAVEDAARAQLDAARDRAERWVAEYRPNALLANQKRQELTIEAATALRHAEQRSAAALDKLAAVARELHSIRTELASIPGAIRTNDAERAARRQALETREKDLRAALAAFGLTT